MDRTGRVRHLAVALVCLVVTPGCVQTVLGQVGLPAGFAPHVQTAQEGRIDWTEGFILADGKGIAESKDPQGQLMAKQAARTVAGRNALAIAAGIHVDAGGRAGHLPNGRLLLEGIIQGHEEVEATWHPEFNPPEMRVRLRVPLWGIQSVSAVFFDAHREQVTRSGARRLPLTTERVEVADRLLVIDARGTGVQASLFPVVVADPGELLHDVSRLPEGSARQRPPARFVETRLTFEQLRAALESSTETTRVARSSGVPACRDGVGPWDDPRGFDHGPGTILADGSGTVPPIFADGCGTVPPSFVFAQPGTTLPAPPTTQPPTTQPASQPTEETRRRERRHVVVKAAGASGAQRTQIVVTAEDAEKLRRSAEGASLLSQGQVVIVVDAAAAGIQGRRDSCPERVAGSGPFRVAWSSGVPACRDGVGPWDDPRGFDHGPGTILADGSGTVPPIFADGSGTVPPTLVGRRSQPKLERWKSQELPGAANPCYPR